MKKYLLIITMFIALSCLAETRSVWVMPWDITSPGAINTVIQTALDAHQNELLVEVRYRADALYDTSRGAFRYPNPEPRSYVLKDDGFDPLDYILQKGHEANLKIQAWVVVFNATPLESGLLAKNYIYQNHRDWITYTRSGRRMTASEQYGYFIDPGIPEVQDYLLNVIGNLVAGYPDLDGLHLDYIRYPSPDLGYHPISVARYEDYCRDYGEISYNAWRMMQVTSFVEKVNKLVKEENPDMLTSAAVFSNITEAKVDYAQNWPDWLQRKLMDRIYTMTYITKWNRFNEQLDQIRLLHADDRIVIGLKAWTDSGRSLISEDSYGYGLTDLSARIAEVRRQSMKGIALFSYSGLKIGNVWKQLTDLCYPPLPEEAVRTIPGEKEEDSTAVSFVLTEAEGEYQLELSLPRAGYWCWEIWDGDYSYAYARLYQEGLNYDHWDGMVQKADSGTSMALSAGKHLVHLYQVGSDYEYLIPVQFGVGELP